MVKMESIRIGSGEMAEAFLSVLKNCYNMAASADKKRYSEEAINTIRNLDAFIVSGVLSKSKVDQFIMENYKMSISEMTRKYNQTHTIEKKESTFRGQYSILGSYVSSVFHLTPDELNEVFANGNADSLRGITDMIHAFGVGTINLSKRFPYLSDDLGLDTETENVYDIRDCQKEIQFLKTVDIQNIRRFSTGIDTDKLSFVLGVLSEPLVEDRYISQTDCKKKVKRAFINHDKLELCKLFHVTQEVSLKPVKKLEVSGASSGGLKEEASQEITNHHEEITNPYMLDLPQKHLEILETGLKRFDSLPEDKKENLRIKAESDDDCYEKCRQFLDSYTLQGFLNGIRNLNPYALREVIEEYKKGGRWK